MARRRSVRKSGLHVLPSPPDPTAHHRPRITQVKKEIGRHKGPKDQLKFWVDLLYRNASDKVLEEYSAGELADIAAWAYKQIESRPRNKKCKIVVDGDRLAVLQDDQRFLVRSLRSLLRRHGLRMEVLLHPIFLTDRDKNGKLRGLAEPDDEAAESFIFVLCEEKEFPSAIISEIEDLMNEVSMAQQDYSLMRPKFTEAVAELESLSKQIPREEIDESTELFRWLGDGNFVLLGYREYEVVRKKKVESLVIKKGSGLGILRDEKRSRFRAPVPLNDLDEELADEIRGGSLLIISKTNSVNSIYRGGRMDYIGLKTLDKNGNIVGERRFLGHFADRANFSSKIGVPLLRRKYEYLRQAFRAAQGSFDDKEIIKLFTNQQVDTLFLTPIEDLVNEFSLAMGELQHDELRASIRFDEVRRGLAVTLVMPQGRYRPAMREEVKRIVGEYAGRDNVDARIIADSTEGGIVRLQFFVPAENRQLETEEILSRIRRAVRTWQERLEDIVRERHGAKAEELIERYQGAFDETFQVIVAPELAADDIENLEEVGDTLFMRWGRPNPEFKVSYLKIFSPSHKLSISEVTPTLVNHGFIVEEENAFCLKINNHPKHNRVFLHIFRLRNSFNNVIGNDVIGERVGRSLVDVYIGKAEDDRLSELIISADLAEREIDLLRTIRNYVWQLNVLPVRKDSINLALLHHPAAVGLMVGLFRARFSPGESSTNDYVELKEKYDVYLGSVTSLDEDRVLRTFFNVIESTVRTNYFRVHEGHRYFSEFQPIVIKIDSSRMTKMPSPRPWREIFVYCGAEMEGCHLRNGPVARGGLRWSERPDDFRTEILGLMKTQVTKNAQIVPTGAKGGFVLKRAPADRSKVFAAVRRVYSLFISSLLDIQDNIGSSGKGAGARDRIIHPDNVVCHDGDDPYLVVAADKGTATFSDFANEIAEYHGFWLGDAFASGGSNGYDHKKVGITARGAWVSVERHFRELGIDISRESITVAGIGDMSGDVFGNGMLLSKTLKLVAAFDHRHIFIDPNPDPALSYKERRRLFRLKRSSWDDYDRDLISKGGGVYSRSEKKISLSAQAREALGVEGDVFDPDALMKAILTAPVDLLYNGGIGTYVKARHEPHLEVGDPQNDHHRVNADELRCSVVGEGGNLGFTQAARIQFALNGGHIYTDAIDNAGGVDLSDHEVNLKILLDSKKTSMKRRTELLRKYEKETVNDVLKNNYFQTLAVSLDEIRTKRFLGMFEGMVHEWEKKNLIDRALEGLPDQDTIKDRRAQGKGLVRPELAVLLAYSKIDLKKRLLESPLMSKSHMLRYVEQYFTPEVRKQFQNTIPQHRLRFELAAAVLANKIVNVHGATLLHQLTTELGLAASRVVEAVLAARLILEVDDLVEDLAGLDSKLSAEDQYQEFLRLDGAVRFTSQWLVRNVKNLRERMGEGFPEYSNLYERFQPLMKNLPTEGEQETYSNGIESRIEKGVPEKIARRLAFLEFVTSVLDVVNLASRKDHTLEQAGVSIFQIGDRLRLGYLIDRINALAARDDWDRAAADNVMADLRRSRRRIAERIADLDISIDEHLRRNFRTARTVESAIARIESETPETIAPYIVVASQIHNLASL